jgi:hypothetical protein
VPLVIRNIRDFCRTWEIGESTYYKAVHQLKQDGTHDWKATEGMTLWKTQGSLYDRRDTGERGSVIAFPVVETVSTERESVSTIVENKALEPQLESGSGGSLDRSKIVLNLKDQDPESISFSEPKEEVAVTPPTSVKTFDSPVCEPQHTQEGAFAAAEDYPKNSKTYVSFESPREKPKLKTYVSFESPALTNSCKPVLCDDPPEFIVPTAQLLENRRKVLSTLFGQGQLKEMGERLKEWLRLKDCPIPELLRFNPEWGFSLKHGRIVQVVLT